VEAFVGFEADANSNGFSSDLLGSILAACMSRKLGRWGKRRVRYAAVKISGVVLPKLVPALRAVRMGSRIAGAVFRIVTGRENPVAVAAEQLLEDWVYQKTGMCTVDVVVETILTLVFEADDRIRRPMTSGMIVAQAYGRSPAMSEIDSLNSRLILCIPWVVQGMVGALPSRYLDSYIHAIDHARYDDGVAEEIVPISAWFQQFADVENKVRVGLDSWGKAASEEVTKKYMTMVERWVPGRPVPVVPARIVPRIPMPTVAKVIPVKVIATSGECEECGRNLAFGGHRGGCSMS
jgi:hypothetical protein